MSYAPGTENLNETLARLLKSDCDLEKADLRRRVQARAMQFLEPRIDFQDRPPPPQSMRYVRPASRTEPSKIRSE